MNKNPLNMNINASSAAEFDIAKSKDFKMSMSDVLTDPYLDQKGD